MTKTALVISGGGPKGAFAVGALQVLAEHGVHFDLVCGTSTGALIAPLVVTSRAWAGELALLERIYTSVETADIVTMRPLVASFLRATGVADAEPLRQLIASVVTRERWDVIRDSPVQMFVAAVQLQTGRAEYFQAGAPPNLSTRQIVHRLQSREELVSAIWASACEPILAPPVRIAGARGPQYVDGGVCDYLPGGIAIENGAADIYAIILRPAPRESADREFGDLGSILMRTIDILAAEVGDGDIATTELVTRAVQYIDAVRASVRERFGLSEQELATLLAPAAALNPFAGKKAVRLTVIRPDAPLVPPSAADVFDPQAMAVMLEKGRGAAKRALAREGATSPAPRVS